MQPTTRSLSFFSSVGFLLVILAITGGSVASSSSSSTPTALDSPAAHLDRRNQAPSSSSHKSTTSYNHNHSHGHGSHGGTSSSHPAPTYHGRATYFWPGEGACGGKKANDHSMIVALNQWQYGNMDERSPNCGRPIKITYGGKSVNAVIQDACPGCPYGALDMSPAVFQKLAPESMGVFQMTWHYTDGRGANIGGTGGPKPKQKKKSHKASHKPKTKSKKTKSKGKGKGEP